MHAHRIEIFDGTNDDDVIRHVAHHFKIEFLPANNGLFDKYATHRRSIKTMLHDLTELLLVPCNTAAGTAHRKARANNHWEPDRVNQLGCFFNRSNEPSTRHFETDGFHRGKEFLAILRALDGVGLCAD